MSPFFSAKDLVWETYRILPDIPLEALDLLRRSIPASTTQNRGAAMFAYGVGLLMAQYPERSPLERKRRRERTEWP